jgi:hypothetical protein
MDEQNKISLMLQNLKRVDEAIDRADSKCATVAAANVGLLSVLVGLTGIVSSIDKITIEKYEGMVFGVAFALYLLFGMGSTIFALLALFPRLRSDSCSLFYFGFLCQYSAVSDLAERFDSLEPQELVSQIAEQLLNSSRIAQTKFEYLKHSIGLLLTSGIIWTLVLVRLFWLFMANITK